MVVERRARNCASFSNVFNVLFSFTIPKQSNMPKQSLEDFCVEHDIAFVPDGENIVVVPEDLHPHKDALLKLFPDMALSIFAEYDTN